MFWHRTETLDYSMVLSGEIDVEFDSGQVVTMKQGDIIVMRGVTHCWKNKSTVPAVTAFILIDAVPFEAAGEKRGVLFSSVKRYSRLCEIVRHFPYCGDRDGANRRTPHLDEG